MSKTLSRANKKFYITTPIYYVNDLPHIGHAYTTIAADILARYHRLLGDDVFFLCGTDENAQKNVESALRKNEKSKIKDKKLGTRKIVQSYVDEMSAKWQSTWDSLEISNNDFIRTSEKRHIEYVKKFWEKVSARGDIYKNTYEGLYCTGCESYKTESELVNGLCPDHKRVPEKLKEENYFFRLSKYKNALLKHIDKHPEFIQPSARRNEVIAYIRDHAQDFSISRKNLEWGIPVPGDPSQTIYVWFDALLNYVSAVTPSPGFQPPSPLGRGEGEGWWPADVHLMAKDIIKFHCAYWPAMLMSAKMPLPKTIFAHGFFTVDGQKMSKTIGNVIDPVKIIEEYGNDVLRYHLFREVSFGSDGDFSLARLRERYQSELANGLGNLVARTLAMIEKYSDSTIPKHNKIACSRAQRSMLATWEKYQEHMRNMELDKALELILIRVHELDKYVDESKPWEIAKHNDKNRLDDVLYILAENLRHLAWALLPFMPDTAKKIFDQLGLEKDETQKTFAKAQKWGGLKKGTKIHKGVALFPRLTN